MAIIDNDIEHGGLEQQNEKSTSADLNISEVERISSPDIPPGVPKEDVVTPKTWLVVCTITLAYGFSYSALPGLAITEAFIAQEYGATSTAGWMVSSFFITGLVAFMLAGHGSDMLGRRWFMISGNLFVPVGYIIAATANNFNQVIAGMAIAGVGGAICQMATFTAPELLPNKWRPAAVSGADSIVLVACTICPVAARYSLQHGTWRWLLWVPVMGNSISAVVLFFFYFPPKHPRGLSFNEAIRQLDYVGGLLFTAAAVLILVGVAFASYLKGTDGRVVGCLVTGFAALVGFACWETWAPLKHALTPPRLFKVNRGRTLTAPFIIAFCVPVYYLGTNIIWGQIVNAVFSPGEPSSHLAMELSVVQGIGMCTGGVLLSVFGRRIKNWKWQMLASITSMTLFGGLLALVSPDRKHALIAFNFLSSVSFAWAQFLSITFCQFGAPQTELGVVGALAGVGRFGGNAIATTVYITVINTSLTKAALQKVPAAVIAAGGTQIMGLELIAAIPAGTPAILAVPGVTVAIANAAGAAFIASLIVAIRTVALVSIVFGGVGMIGCFWCEDIEPKMDKHIEVFLENDVQAVKNQYH